MNNFRAVIDRWPSLQTFADDLGVKYVTAQLMRHRNSIASKHWRGVVLSARKRKIEGVTLEKLASFKAGRKKQPRPNSRVQRTAEAAA